MHIKITVEAVGPNADAAISQSFDIASGATHEVVTKEAEDLARQLARWAARNSFVKPIGAPAPEQPSPKVRATKQKEA